MLHLLSVDQVTTCDCIRDVEAEFYACLHKGLKFEEEVYKALLRMIEGATPPVCQDGIVYSRFGKTLLSNISTGSKGALVAVTYPEKCILGDELGLNVYHALSVVDADSTVVCRQAPLWFPATALATVNGTLYQGDAIVKALISALGEEDF